MLGRKREAHVPKSQQAPAKRRWQEEIDDDEAEVEVTAEELERWRKQQQKEEATVQKPSPVKGRKSRSRSRSRSLSRSRSRNRNCDDRRKLSVSASISASEEGNSGQSEGANESTKKQKAFAWMDSDEEDNAEGEENAARQAPPQAPPVPAPPLPNDQSSAQAAQRNALSLAVLQMAGASGAFGEPLAMQAAAMQAAAAPTSGTLPGQSNAGFGHLAAGTQQHFAGTMLATTGVANLQMQAAGIAMQQAIPGAVSRWPPPPPMQSAARPALSPQQAWARSATMANVRNINAGLEDERMVGRIKRCIDMPDGGGYGFIDCEDAKLRFSRDVYIPKNQMHGLGLGDAVSFQITRNAKGEPQARNVMRADESVLSAQVHAQQSQVAWPSIGGTTPIPSSAPWGGLPPATEVTPPGASVPTNQASGCASALVSPSTMSSATSLMDETQARQFQAALRGTGL